MSGQPWTHEDERTLGRLSKQGVKPRNMVRHFPGRTVKAISHQLWRLGLSRHIYSTFGDASPLYSQVPLPEDSAHVERADRMAAYEEADADWALLLGGRVFSDHGQPGA